MQSNKAEKLAIDYIENKYIGSMHENIAEIFIAGFHSRDDEVKKLREALEFTLGCTRNLLCDPENKGLPVGLDPTFYHTLSYDGDMALRDKYFKAKQALE